MSTPPPPQQPPGPYGPPQHPNPYAGQQYAPQPSPHPGQPPYPGQQPYPGQPPHPGQPYPPQPYPGQGAWGRPPMGPPRKNRAGLVIGIVAVSLVALGALGFGVNRLKEAGSVASGTGFPEAQYRLTVPKTMLDGKFELTQDLSDTEGKKALKGTYDSKIRNPQPVVAQYTSDLANRGSALVISGMYGQFKDPDGARKKMLRGAEDAQGASLAVPARDITPAGSDVTLSCQVMTMKQNAVESSFPMCAWADENTGATVGLLTPETARQKPASVDLAKIAEATLKVRAESRKPIG